MTKRKNISSDTPWEEKFGYSRAVKIGDLIEVSGTTAVRGNKILFPGDAYGQTKFIIQKISKSISEAGGSLNDVIRTRIYTTNIRLWPDIARGHSEFFSKIKPATTLVEVKALIKKELLVEIEATARLTK